MIYERSLPLHGDTSSAMSLAFATFTGSGLRITERTASQISIEGSGRRGTYTSILSTLSRGELRLEVGHLILRAEFDGLRRLSLVFGILFAVTTAGLAMVLGLLWALGLPSIAWYLLWSAVPGLALWLVILPLLLHHYRRRAEHELDTLLNNLTMASTVPDAAIAAPVAIAQ